MTIRLSNARRLHLTPLLLSGLLFTAATAGPTFAATAKAGAKCTKAGAKSRSLVCTKKAGKLVWSKAAAITPKATDTVPAGATPTTAAGASAGTLTSVDGTWKPASTSQVGFRVKEVLFGQSTEAVGRTNAVTGTLVIAGTKATGVDLTVDMKTLTSDESKRNAQIQGRIMDTATFPTATLKLVDPIDFGKIPSGAETISTKAKVNLTLRGTTKPVDVNLQARLNGANIEVIGTIPILFSDFGIPNPSVPGISTEDKGLLEFALAFTR